MVNIYSLSDPITGEIRYVGKTIHNIQRRLYFHIHDSKSRNYHNANWIRSLATTQLQPIVELLDVVENENWEFWEQYWICQCKSWGFRLTNHTSGGGGVVGIFVSEETNKKKSETMKKKFASGELFIDDKRRKKISEIHKGKTVSEKTKEKIRNKALGRKHPESFMLKKSKITLQYDLEGNFIKEWKSITDAANTLGILKGGISKAIHRSNLNTSYKGFIWKFKN